MHRTIDHRGLFTDNFFKRKMQIVWHWTGGASAGSSVRWLNFRKNGEGSVGYHHIIGRDGTDHYLADPRVTWMHTTGLGGKFDKGVISISFANKGNGEKITDEQIKTAGRLKLCYTSIFDLTPDEDHKTLNPHKPDFPELFRIDFFKRLAMEVDK